MRDHYHHTLIAEALNHGFDWTLINYRGVSHRASNGVPFSTSEFQSFRESVRHIIDKNPNRQIFLVGSSLGGNVAANILKEFDDGSITAAVLTQPSLDLQ